MVYNLGVSKIELNKRSLFSRASVIFDLHPKGLSRNLVQGGTNWYFIHGIYNLTKVVVHFSHNLSAFYRLFCSSSLPRDILHPHPSVLLTEIP